MVKKLDKDLKMKKVYKYLLAILGTLAVGLILFLNLYQYQNEWVDRFNPFMSMDIGYVTLPTEVTYNGGQSYNESEGSQYPDPYEDLFVTDTPFGEGTYLTFSGGQSPEGKNYAMVEHKGLYVKRISFISWTSIPGPYRDIMSEEYFDYERQEGEPNHH